jgi:putative ABC transport system substrate-binding protein
LAQASIALRWRRSLSTAELEPALKAFAVQTRRGLIVLPSPITKVHRSQVVALAAQYRLPAVYGFRSFVVSGGLVSYGIDTTDAFRRSAVRSSYPQRCEALRIASRAAIQGRARDKKTASALGIAVPPIVIPEGQSDQSVQAACVKNGYFVGRTCAPVTVTDLQ